MKIDLNDLPIADGKIQFVRTSLQNAEIGFTDWQDVKWLLRFYDVLAVENLNIEGEELDRLEITSGGGFIDRARELVDEPDAAVNCFAFFTPWKEQARLRVVAGSCEVYPT
jgi:hypothetical protein